LYDIQGIKERFSWKVEPYVWDASSNRLLKHNNRPYTRLANFYDFITFIQKHLNELDLYYKVVNPLLCFKNYNTIASNMVPQAMFWVCSLFDVLYL